jgi:hypothetical protein
MCSDMPSRAPMMTAATAGLSAIYLTATLLMLTLYLLAISLIARRSSWEITVNRTEILSRERLFYLTALKSFCCPGFPMIVLELNLGNKTSIGIFWITTTWRQTWNRAQPPHWSIAYLYLESDGVVSSVLSGSGCPKYLSDMKPPNIVLHMFFQMNSIIKNARMGWQRCRKLLNVRLTVTEGLKFCKNDTLESCQPSISKIYEDQSWLVGGKSMSHI